MLLFGEVGMFMLSFFLFVNRVIQVATFKGGGRPSYIGGCEYVDQRLSVATV